MEKYFWMELTVACVFLGATASGARPIYLKCLLAQIGG